MDSIFIPALLLGTLLCLLWLFVKYKDGEENSQEQLPSNESLLTLRFPAQIVQDSHYTMDRMTLSGELIQASGNLGRSLCRKKLDIENASAYVSVFTIVLPVTGLPTSRECEMLDRWLCLQPLRLVTPLLGSIYPNAEAVLYFDDNQSDTTPSARRVVLTEVHPISYRYMKDSKLEVTMKGCWNAPIRKRAPRLTYSQIGLAEPA